MKTVLYIAGREGVVTARNLAGSWQIEKSALSPRLVEDMEIIQGQPNIVLAATRGEGVWLSKDFGLTWIKPNFGRRGPSKVRCVRVSPVNTHQIFAGCEPIELFVSDNLGNSWNPIDSVWDDPSVAEVTYPVPTVEPHVRDIAIDPSDPAKIYLALQVGYILKSVDSGTSWSISKNGIDADVHTISIDRTMTGRLLLATGGHDSRLGKIDGKALYGSEDFGRTWRALATEYPQDYSVPLVRDPVNPAIAYSALANGNPGEWNGRSSGAESIMIKTTDGGASWKELDIATIPEARRSMVVSIAIDASQPESIYAVLKSGDCVTSSDSGETWSSMEISLQGASSIECVNA